jgi:hypothetical protein
LELPKTVQRALEIDAETCTSHWRDAINKEMKTVFPAFEFLDEGKSAPPGFNQISCHLVFDIKFDFTRKARFVANPHGAGGLAVQNFDFRPAQRADGTRYYEYILVYTDDILVAI